MQGWEQRVGRRREAEKGGGLRQAGVGVKEAESWGVFSSCFLRLAF